MVEGVDGVGKRVERIGVRGEGRVGVGRSGLGVVWWQRGGGDSGNAGRVIRGELRVGVVATVRRRGGLVQARSGCGLGDLLRTWLGKVSAARSKDKLAGPPMSCVVWKMAGSVGL